jgi:hypothetical protein
LADDQGAGADAAAFVYGDLNLTDLSFNCACDLKKDFF